MKKYLAESIGTFALVFCGTGSMIVNDLTNGTITHVGIAITFGAIVAAMIYAFGNISGAHINPAVSIAFSITDRFDKKYLLGYIAFQLLGALSASGLLKLLFLEHDTLGSTIPIGSCNNHFY